MKKNHNPRRDLESEFERRYQKKDNKKIKQMKVSGKSVFKIKSIITDKSKRASGGK